MTTIYWETHLPQAMQRHAGSVKNAEKSPKPDDESAIPLVPEYGDPLWMNQAAADDARSEEEPTAG